MVPVDFLSSTYFTDSFEEREAINLLNDKSRDLALKFADVKVEFCDLDGMSARSRATRSEKYLSAGEPTIRNIPRERCDSSSFAIQMRPEDTITPPLRTAGASTPYFSLQRRSSFGKAATDIKRRLSFKKGSQTAQLNNVAVEDSPDGITHIRYTAGTSLYRSGFSTFESTTGVYEDSDGDSDTSSLVNCDLQLEDDVETPRPLSRVREASSNSYFDDKPPKIPTVPTVPSLPVPTLTSLDDSLDPNTDPSSIPEPTIPPLSLSPLSDSDPVQSVIIRPWSIPKRSNHRRTHPISIPPSSVYPHPHPPGLEPCSKNGTSSPSGMTTTLLSPVSVQIKFSPTLTSTRATGAENEGNSGEFWRTSCVSETMVGMDLDLDLKGMIRPISKNCREGERDVVECLSL
ncbi:hypothetical protein L218DRAFT_991559 [Marasmius fiardii PR-910]|nr:hypothetical protein L218DRAFT_991559 [Marasmius fiardii PR-910]